MSFGRSGNRKGPVHYRIGTKPAPKSWHQKRVGWPGKVFVMALLALFFGFGYSVRTILLDEESGVLYSNLTGSDNPSLPLSAKPEIKKPQTAKKIVDLQSSLDEWGKGHASQKWSVVVKSLDGPDISANINQDEVHDPAGLYKLFAIMPLSAQMPFDRQQQTMVTVNGSKKTVIKCVDLMLRIADNSCGLAVGNYLNLYRANAQFKQVGLKDTAFGSSVTSLKTTARDTATLLAHVNGSLLDPTAQKIVTDAMTNQIFRDGLPAGCPGCKMANSAGFSGDSVYDVAVVSYSQGKYVVVVFSEGGAFEDVAKLGGIVHQRVLDSIR